MAEFLLILLTAIPGTPPEAEALAAFPTAEECLAEAVIHAEAAYAMGSQLHCMSAEDFVAEMKGTRA